MTSLRSNIVKRIERLPKPVNVADALQPLFEAISNAIHSTQARFPDTVSNQGKVDITVSTDRKKDNVWAIVEDNGLGLNERNWNAFLTTDTDNKIRIGGKGVGRLLWLDCFNRIEIVSVYEHEGEFFKRSFDFFLSLDDQIQNYYLEPTTEYTAPFFRVKFSGLRHNGYLDCPSSDKLLPVGA